jgi:lipid II:glycine glycyltransferase (peptidoglycan interpeptide bridge formation enzyme)
MWLLVEINRQVWNGYWAKIELANLLQSWEYGEAKRTAERWKPRRFVIKNESGHPRGVVQVLTKTLPVVGGVARINRGPLLFDAHPENDRFSFEVSQALTAILRMARKERWWYLSIAPEALQSSTANELLEKLGFKPGRGSAWGSAMLSLESSEEDLLKNLKGKWRNLLRKAQSFQTDVLDSATQKDIDLVIQKYSELQQAAGFKGIPEGIIRNLSVQSGPKFDFILLWAKEQDNSSPVGLTVIVGHGDTCTYFIGWTSPEGRKLQANYLLLWTAILICKKKGFSWFELGGISEHTPKGIAHFKEGIGGIRYDLIGEWNWHIGRMMSFSEIV